jgi:uncharacterized RDD family membrane protein YckC
MADRPRQLDNRLEIVTPENIAFEYRLAGPFWRLPAYLIDLLITFASIVVVGLACLFTFGMVRLGGIGIMFFLITWFVSSWFYGGLFETFWNGQTPGKKLLGLRVVRLDGRPINALQAIMRNFLRSVDSLPTYPLIGGLVTVPCYLVGVSSCLLTTRYQRLGDLACGTIVIIEERAFLGNLVRFDDPIVANMSAILPADFAVSRSLGKALAAYADRRRYMTPSRRAEVARHVGATLVERFNLPLDTSHDLLLCALYHRTFVTEHQVVENKKPFAFTPEPPAPSDEELLQMVK